MTPYITALKVRFINGLQYRTAALSGLMTQFFWGIMAIFVYQAFYKSGKPTNTISFSGLVTYIWLQQAFLVILMLYEWDTELIEMITLGNISYELCRPYNLYFFWYVKLLSKRLSNAALRFLPVILLAFLMPKPYKLSLPHSPISFLLFLVTLSIGLLLLVSISMLIYLSIFKTMSPVGSITFLGIVGEFFSGMTIPIPLMPDWLKTICYILPFRWYTDLPLRVYSGSIGTTEAFTGIFIQIAWILLLVSLGFITMQRVTKNVIVQGG